MEIITGAERRRRWRDEDKLRIVAEAEAPGAVFALVARRHEISRGQLGVHPALLRFYTVRSRFRGRFGPGLPVCCVPIRFMACYHGVQCRMHAMFPNKVPYCTP